jgi:hypothetical protein
MFRSGLHCLLLLLLLLGDVSAVLQFPYVVISTSMSSLSVRVTFVEFIAKKY